MSSSARARALEKKAALQSEKDAKAKIVEEQAEAATWNAGARDCTKQQANAAKEMEKLQKKQELEALMAADEASLSTVGKPPSSGKKKKVSNSYDALGC